ncbi:hypothetical protein GCM10023329_22470 [Streptomyces sanyensis]|uniref:Uncharacterized protein n=1 Tax=Streptomyces sanyensis TaxID=568869 RepID=A0ABP9A575_9ACTN
MGGEGTGLLEHGVDDGRLAVVDVGDDGDVADVVARGHGWLALLSGRGFGVKFLVRPPGGRATAASHGTGLPRKGLPRREGTGGRDEDHAAGAGCRGPGSPGRGPETTLPAGVAGGQGS